MCQNQTAVTALLDKLPDERVIKAANSQSKIESAENEDSSGSDTAEMDAEDSSSKMQSSNTVVSGSAGESNNVETEKQNDPDPVEDGWTQVTRKKKR